MTLELRIERGRRQGEAVALRPGEPMTIGTGTKNVLVLRDAGVGFRHLVLLLGGAGDVTLEDLAAAGGTFVNDAPVPSRTRRPLIIGDRVRVGTEAELVLAEPAPLDPETVFAPRPDLDPFAPEAPLGLRDALRTTVPLPEALAAADPERRAAIEAEVPSFVADARRIVRGRWVGGPPERWVRVGERPDDLMGCCWDAAGSGLLLRRWDVLAVIGPDPTSPREPWLQATHVVRRVIEQAERMTPTLLLEDAPGVWRWERESERPMVLGRFSAIRAATDGEALIVELVPAVISHAPPELVREDVIAQALADAKARQVYRPPTMGPAPNVEPMPPGGRFGRARHLPKRSK